MCAPGLGAGQRARGGAEQHRDRCRRSSSRRRPAARRTACRTPPRPPRAAAGRGRRPPRRQPSIHRCTVPPYSTASLVRPIAAGSFFATGAIGQQPQPLRTRGRGRYRARAACAARSRPRGAEICTEPHDRRGGRDQERDRGRIKATALRDLLDDRRRRVLRGLEAEDRSVGVLAPGQLLEQVFGPGQRTTRAAGHREEILVLELPAGVLRGQAGGGGFIDGDADAGPGPLADGYRQQVEPAQAAHACGREAQAGLESAAGLGAAIHHPRARVQRSDLDPQRRQRRRPGRPPTRAARSFIDRLTGRPRRRRSGSRPE